MNTKVMAWQNLPPLAATWLSSGNRAWVARTPLIVVDLDGTLCDPSKRLHFLEADPPDWTSFSRAAIEDAPISCVLDVLRDRYASFPMVVVSGRPSYVVEDTRVWLDAHSVGWDLIALRPPGDRVSGVAHKLRVLQSLREWGVEPCVAIDDSPIVRAAYREAGVVTRVLGCDSEDLLGI